MNLSQYSFVRSVGKIGVVIGLGLGLLSVAAAHDGHEDHDWAKNPQFQQCAQDAGVTKGQKPTEAQMEKMRSCMEAAHKAAESKCANADKAKVQECMTAAGFTHPHGPHGDHHHHMMKDHDDAGTPAPADK